MPARSSSGDGIHVYGIDPMLRLMLKNRSVPADILLPHLVYEKVAEASAWLTRVFGFEEHYRYGDPSDPQGALMHLGEAWIMLRTEREDSATPKKLGKWTQSLTVFVDDVDGHYARAKAAGAEIVEELHETMYGERQYAVVDLGGHHWLFSRHARDVGPEEWGATVKENLDDAWPQEVLGAAGIAPDFLSAAELREGLGEDGPREKLD